MGTALGVGRGGSEATRPGFFTVLLLPRGVTLEKFLRLSLSFSLSIWKLKMLTPLCKVAQIRRGKGGQEGEPGAAWYGSASLTFCCSFSSR